MNRLNTLAKQMLANLYGPSTPQRVDSDALAEMLRVDPRLLAPNLPTPPGLPPVTPDTRMMLYNHPGGAVGSMATKLLQEMFKGR